MSSERLKIVDTVVKKLKNKTNAGPNVYPNFTEPPASESMPYVLVYSTNENVEEFNQAPRELKRTLFITIECHDMGDENSELYRNLDELADQVEQLVSEDDSLDCTVDDIIVNSIEFQYEGEESESPTGLVRVIFSARYRTLTPRDQGELPDFDSAGVEWDIGENNGVPDGVTNAEDLITIEQ